MSIFSERLKWLREKKGFTQKEMGEKLGISGPSYSKYEYGLREPNLETLAKLPDILGESLDFIVGVTDYDKETKALISTYRATYQSYTRAIEKLHSHGVTDKFDPEEMARREKYVDWKEESIKEYESKIIDNLKSTPCLRSEVDDIIRNLNAPKFNDDRMDI